jgi:hypothetical protein
MIFSPYVISTLRREGLPNKSLLQSPHTLKEGRRALRHGGL